MKSVACKLRLNGKGFAKHIHSCIFMIRDVQPHEHGAWDASVACENLRLLLLVLFKRGREADLIPDMPHGVTELMAVLLPLSFLRLSLIYIDDAIAVDRWGRDKLSA